MIHNPTNGFASDAAECIPQRLGLLTKVASTTAEILSKFDLPTARIVAHSQGTMILNNSLRRLDQQGKDMRGLRVEVDGAAAQTWRMGRFLEGVGAQRLQVYGNPFDPVHNVIGLNTLNPLRIVGSIIATPLLFSKESISPHTNKEGFHIPHWLRSTILHPLMPYTK
jgi:hypothetical protein